MNIDLTQRVAIVTGGARRIGRMICLTLADAGACVVVNARANAADAESVAAEIAARGGRALACVADVANPDDVARMTAAAVDAFGGLDILVNNAAIRPNQPLSELDLQKWRAVLAVILDGSFLCARAAAPYLKGNKRGRLINIGGSAAHRGAVNRLHVIAAKSGLIGLTKGLALELAPHATANCVVPGLIEDISDSPEEFDARRRRLSPELAPIGRTGAPQDVAGMVAFLASEAGGYITGQTLHVSGGLYFP